MLVRRSAGVYRYRWQLAFGVGAGKKLDILTAIGSRPVLVLSSLPISLSLFCPAAVRRPTTRTPTGPSVPSQTPLVTALENGVT